MARLTDMLRIQVDCAQPECSRQMLKKRRLVTDQSNLRILVMAPDVMYRIVCTQFRRVVFTVYGTFHKAEMLHHCIQ